jgi:hypothetical protein
VTIVPAEYKFITTKISTITLPHARTIIKKLKMIVFDIVL